MLKRYVAQVRLLVDVLPDIAREFAFALKGGTAINLFYRDMPRLSVDVDLTRLPVGDRASALSDISSALDRIGAMITKRDPRLTVHRIAGGGGAVPVVGRWRSGGSAFVWRSVVGASFALPCDAGLKAPTGRTGRRSQPAGLSGVGGSRGFRSHPAGGAGVNTGVPGLARRRWGRW